MINRIKIQLGLFILKHVHTVLKFLNVNIENLTDGYHSFKELYDYRMLYNALYFNELASVNYSDYNFNKPELNMETFVKYNVHKSFRHNDGQLCFGGGWFIVVAVLPTGQITNHYEEKYWDLFKIPALEKSNVKYDGHSPKDVKTRMERYATEDFDDKVYPL